MLLLSQRQGLRSARHAKVAGEARFARPRSSAGLQRLAALRAAAPGVQPRLVIRLTRVYWLQAEMRWTRR